MGIGKRTLGDFTRDEPVLDLLQHSDLVGKGRVEDVTLDSARETVATSGVKGRLRRARAHFKFDRIYKGNRFPTTIEYFFETMESPFIPPPLMTAGEYALLYLRKGVDGFEFCEPYNPFNAPVVHHFHPRMIASPLSDGEESTDPAEMLLSDFIAGLADENREAKLSIVNHVGNIRCRRAIFHLRKLIPAADNELLAVVLLALIRCGDAPALEEFAAFSKQNCCACVKHPSYEKTNYHNNGFNPLIEVASKEILDLRGRAWIPGLAKSLALCNENICHGAFHSLMTFPPAERIPQLINALGGAYRSMAVFELQIQVPGITNCHSDPCGCGPDNNDWPKAVKAWLSWWESSGKQKYAPSPR